jgi:hypothetical protein
MVNIDEHGRAHRLVTGVLSKRTVPQGLEGSTPSPSAKINDFKISLPHRRMSEQEIVDALNARKAPHYQRHDSKEPDHCGHYNCTYHGICILTEFIHLFGQEGIYEYIDIVPEVSREEMCHCKHRCASVEFAGRHTGYMSQRDENNLCPCQV